MFFTNPTSTSLFCSLTLCCRSNPRKKFSLLLVKSRFYDCLDPHQGPFVTRKKNIHRSLFHDVEKSIQSIFLHWKIENMFLDFLILSRNLPATVMDWYTSDKYWNNPNGFKTNALYTCHPQRRKGNNSSRLRYPSWRSSNMGRKSPMYATIVFPWHIVKQSCILEFAAMIRKNMRCSIVKAPWLVLNHN